MARSGRPAEIVAKYEFTEEQVDQGFAAWAAEGLDSEERIRAELLALMNPTQHPLQSPVGGDLAASVRSLAKLDFIKGHDDVFQRATALRARMIARLHLTLKVN